MVVLAIVLLVLLAGVDQQQAIGDWLRLRGYTPNQEVTALADTDTFTSTSRHLFYINRPEIIPKSEFVGSCNNTKAEQTIVLGCYHGVQNGIFVLRIANDSRLNGVMQVTAAHEMLHAAYDRLSNSERTKVNAMLEDYYHHQLKDARIQKTIAA